MGVQGTKKSAEALHEIFMGIFLFLSSPLSRHRSEKHPNQTFWVQEACRNGSCRSIFDLLGKGGIEKALSLQSQLLFSLILASRFSNKLRYICFLQSLKGPEWILTVSVSSWELEQDFEDANFHLKGIWEKIDGIKLIDVIEGKKWGPMDWSKVPLKTYLQCFDLGQSQEVPGRQRQCLDGYAMVCLCPNDPYRKFA